MQTYIVQKGDTLYGISKQFGVSVQDIKTANNLSNNTITVGQTLMIPSMNTTIFYIVKKGDTLYSIASNYGVSVDEIKSLNNLKSNTLSIGQQLRIPVNDNVQDEPFGYTIYTVRVGDTLYSIAKKNNTTVEQIKNINNLTTDVLTVGQQLKIPYNTMLDDAFDNDYLIYVVKKGDSLYSIAKKYNMSVAKLIEINDLKSNVISIGQQLKVIVGKDNAIPLGSTCYKEGYTGPSYETYTVKRGDNLYNIAKKYGVTVDSIKKLNDLTSNDLSIGQILKIKEVDS